MTEGGSAGTYTVALAAQPSGTVTVSLRNDLRLKATVAPLSLTFTTTSWSTSQTVTVTPKQDGDGHNESVQVTHVASGGDYEDVSAVLGVLVYDDDANPELRLSTATLTLTEGGSAGSYTVVLAGVYPDQRW